MTELEQQPQTNGIEVIDEDDINKARPADIEAVRSNHNFTFKNDFIVTDFDAKLTSSHFNVGYA